MVFTHRLCSVLHSLCKPGEQCGPLPTVASPLLSFTLGKKSKKFLLLRLFLALIALSASVSLLSLFYLFIFLPFTSFTLLFLSFTIRNSFCRSGLSL